MRAYAVWRRLFWLPEPVYYWLLDLFAGNKGWRPLRYRSTPRVWGWACPWSGETDEAMTWRYRVWFALYRRNQIARHVIGLHERQRHYSIAPRCDWCGKPRRTS